MRWLIWTAIAASWVLIFSFSGVTNAAPATASTGSITGSVTKDGQPAAHVRVLLFAPQKGAHLGKALKAKAKGNGAGTDAPKPVAQTTTDADGKFTLDGVAAGTYVVIAFERGEGRAHERVVVADGQSPSVKLALTKGATNGKAGKGTGKKAAA